MKTFVGFVVCLEQIKSHTLLDGQENRPQTVSWFMPNVNSRNVQGLIRSFTTELETKVLETF
jgi:hypothetical protein